MLTKVISTKSVFGDKEKILETVMSDKAREHFLYRVFGAIEAQKIGKSKHKRVNKETGEAEETFWTKFYGEFFAMSANGQNFEAATCFLPDYVNDQFAGALDGDGQVSIEFAFDVFARYNKDSITSYEFIANPVKKAGEESVTKRMLAALPPLPNAKALPAPEKEGKKK